MPISTFTKDGMLNGLRNVAWQKATVYASCHTASPGNNGANEMSGGSPAYARKAISFNAASGGNPMTTSADVLIDVPVGTVAFVGLWDALTVGNFLGYVDVTDEVFAAQGVYTILAGSAINLNA